MNVLYLSYDGMTDPLGQSQVLPYLFGIAKAGHRITLVSFEKQNRFQSFRHNIQTLCKDNNIDWQPLLYTKRPPVLSTVWDIIKLRRKAFALHGKNRFDVVHSRSYISALVGLSLKRTKGVKFIFDMRGFWADERVEGNLWNLKNPLYKTIYNYFKRKEIQFLNEADCTISLTQNAADEIHTWKTISHQPVSIEVIPCCADMKLFDPATVSDDQQMELCNKLNIHQNDFVLSYIGSLGTWYMLDEMLDFFKTLLQQNAASKFLVITNDPETDLKNKADERKIPFDKIVVTQAPRKLMPLYISLSNATLFFIRPTFSKKASSPVKQGEAMGMGLAIICNSGIGDTDRIVQQSKAGIVLNQLNESTYSQSLAALMKNKPDKHEIRKHALGLLSLESGVEKYLRVYKNLSS